MPRRAGRQALVLAASPTPSPPHPPTHAAAIRDPFGNQSDLRVGKLSHGHVTMVSLICVPTPNRPGAQAPGTPAVRPLRRWPATRDRFWPDRTFAIAIATGGQTGSGHARVRDSRSAHRGSPGIAPLRPCGPVDR